MYNSCKHGRAEYGHYMQIPNGELSAILEGDDSIALLNQRFAILTYQVNTPPVVISGDVVVDSVGLDDSGMVGVTLGGDLQVFDQAVVDAINNISVSTSLSAVGINASGDVKLSGDQLKTFDQGVIDKLTAMQITVDEMQTSVDILSGQLIQNNYSRVIQERADDVYFAHAEPGTSAATPAWRVQKVDIDGSRSWADNANFSQLANIELSALAYTY
jgi:hypothetical protein